MKIRLSPSGPIIGEAGPGFILAQAFGNADIDPAYFVVADAAAVELKADPAAPAAAPFVRPELTAIELDKAYTVEANIATRKTSDFTTAVGDVYIDYSTDSGASWTTLSQTTYLVRGGGAEGANNQQWEVETAPVLGSTLTGAVEGGSLMVRARWGQVGGVSLTMNFNGTSTLGDVGGFNLKIKKQLPA